MLHPDQTSGVAPPLRSYQIELVEKGLAALGESGSAVLQLATAGGKTYVAVALIQHFIRTGKRVWFVCHRREMMQRTGRDFDKFGLFYGRVGADAKFYPERPVQLCSVDTLGHIAANLPAPDLIIWDECHHLPARTWTGLRDSHSSALHVGLTATPCRLDGKPLSHAFAQLVCGPPARWLREQGHLADYRHFAPAMPDLAGVKIRDRDYNPAELDAVMRDNVVVGDVVEHYRRHADGRRALLFAVSVEASLDLVRRFNEAGVAAAHVDAKTPAIERDAAIESLRAGRVKILSNVELFTEGLDLPDLGAVILMRPTRSLTLYHQMIGRVMRPGSEQDAIVLDHAGLCGDHGLADTDYVWTLDGERPSRSGGTRERLRRCLECHAVHAWANECPACGHVYTEPERAVTEVVGALREVTAPPPGLMTRLEYARHLGLRDASRLKYRISKGLPVDRSGFIDPMKADAWNVQRAAQNKQAHAETMRRMWADPVHREKILPVFRQSFVDPTKKADRIKTLTETARDPLRRQKAAEKTRQFYIDNPDQRQKRGDESRARGRKNT